MVGIEGRDDVGMIQLGRRARFLLKTRQRAALVEKFWVDDLERDLPRHVAVLGKIDGAHAAAAKQANEPIAWMIRQWAGFRAALTGRRGLGLVRRGGGPVLVQLPVGVGKSQLIDETMKLAHELANGPTVALSLIRKLYWESPDNSFEDQLNLEFESQRIAGSAEDFKEGVTAFLEKRPAKFRGK